MLQAYPLDIDRINELFDKYVSSVELEVFDARVDSSYATQLRNIPGNLLSGAKRDLEECGIEPTLKNINLAMNMRINNSRSMKRPPSMDSGVYLKTCPKEIVLVQKEDGTIDISDENKEEIKILIEVAKQEERKKYQSLKQEINDHYDRIYPGKRKNNEEVRST